MTDFTPIIGSDPWQASAAGRYLLDWEQAELDRIVADCFGFHAVQLGWTALDALRSNRMPHRWRLSQTPEPGADLLADFEALPFPARCLDLVVMPHTLELSRDPHQTLREAERVLVGEGRIVILGFNPASLWGLQRIGCSDLPTRSWISRQRLRDWLRLLGFEIEQEIHGLHRPLLQRQRWLDRLAWMDRLGPRGWPGAGVITVAVKRVYGMRRLEARRQARRLRLKLPVAVPTRQRQQCGDE
jgi:SAM-dependent methyltransferase